MNKRTNVVDRKKQNKNPHGAMKVRVKKNERDLCYIESRKKIYFVLK